MKRLAALALALLLSGCGITAALQGAGPQIGSTVMAIDSDIYAVAVAKYQAAQMFKAQIDGTIQLPPLPPPPPIPPSPFPGPVVINPGGGPVIVNPMPPGPIQPPTPVPVPNARARRHASAGTLTPPSDLHSMFGSDGHLLPSAMVQATGL